MVIKINPNVLDTKYGKVHEVSKCMSGDTAQRSNTPNLGKQNGLSVNKEFTQKKEKKIGFYESKNAALKYVIPGTTVRIRIFKSEL